VHTHTHINELNYLCLFNSSGQSMASFFITELMSTAKLNRPVDLIKAAL